VSWLAATRASPTIWGLLEAEQALSRGTDLAPPQPAAPAAGLTVWIVEAEEPRHFGELASASRSAPNSTAGGIGGGRRGRRRTARAEPTA